MHLQFKKSKLQHSDFATCICWLNANEILSCGDDHLLILWNFITLQPIKKIQIESNIYPTDLASFSSPKVTTNLNNQSSTNQLYSNSVILSSTDGQVHFINLSNEKIEKSIQAHQGSVISLKISNDGSALLSSGEDGLVKIWSKTGLLRNTLASEECVIHCAIWCSDLTERVLYTIGSRLCLKPLIPNSKSIEWDAHNNSIIRAIDWNHKQKLILSSDEIGFLKFGTVKEEF